MVVMGYEVQVFDLLLSLMADTDDDEGKLVALFNIKENLKDYSFGKLKSIAFALIDSFNDFSKDKERLMESLEKYEEKVIELSVQVTELTNEKGKSKDDLEKCEE